MELEQLTDLISGNYEDLQKAIEKDVTRPKITDYLKEYRVKDHKIMDPAIRKDKLVETANGPQSVAVARLSVPFQKRIVAMAVTFLCGRPVQLSARPADQNQIDLLGALQQIWDDNKLDYDTQELARILFSETEVAEIWYEEEVQAGYWGAGAMEKSTRRLRMKIIAGSLGDTLYPVYNAAGDMIAFGRGYKSKIAGKEVENYDLYTADNTYMGVKGEGGWVATSTPNPVKKIPVIYYSRPGTEWEDVQTIIDRFEMMISRRADTNDYFGAPMVTVKGEIKGFANKGEDGKVLELTNDAEAKYLTWDQSPANVENEFKANRSLILDFTDTPDISFENMKGLGAMSGTAIRLMFLGAHMKASTNEQVFGKGVQRRLNFMKAAIGSLINSAMAPTVPLLNVKPKFEYFLPKDIEGDVTTLVNAVGTGKAILSRETAVRMNPLVTDPETELKLIQNEQDQLGEPLPEPIV
jgi:SPP1 family phage portal protein